MSEKPNLQDRLAIFLQDYSQRSTNEIIYQDTRITFTDFAPPVVKINPGSNRFEAISQLFYLQQHHIEGMLAVFDQNLPRLVFVFGFKRDNYSPPENPNRFLHLWKVGNLDQDAGIFVQQDNEGYPFHHHQSTGPIGYLNFSQALPNIGQPGHAINITEMSFTISQNEPVLSNWFISLSN